MVGVRKDAKEILSNIIDTPEPDYDTDTDSSDISYEVEQEDDDVDDRLTAEEEEEDNYQKFRWYLVEGRMYPNPFYYYHPDVQVYINRFYSDATEEEINTVNDFYIRQDDSSSDVEDRYHYPTPELATLYDEEVEPISHLPLGPHSTVEEFIAQLLSVHND